MFTIVSISDSDKHRQAVVEEYTKRLGRSVKIINLKPHRNGTTQQMIAKDTEMIIAQLKKFPESTKILLSKDGKQLDTLGLHKFLTNKNAVFIIGGPYGLDEKLLSKHLSIQISF